MAGDWIKMRTNLWDDPRVAKICDLTDQGEAPIVGGLYWLWAMADSHTEDGILPGLTLKAIDRKTGIQGFGDALCAVGWLADHPEGVRIVGFEQHNGSSAKRRCTDAQRKANGRTQSDSNPQDVRNLSASEADKTRKSDGQKTDNCGAREEKRREESNTDSSLRSESRRATKKCPDSFVVTDDLKAWAAAECPNVDLAKQTASFRDYTFKTARSDWASTWRNWIRKAAEHVGAQPRASPMTRPPSAAELRLFHSSPHIMDADSLARCRAYTGEKPKQDFIDMEPTNANAIAMD